METVIGRLTSFAASVECITKSIEENSDDSSIKKNVSTITDVLSSSWVQSFKNAKPESGMEKYFQLKFFAKQLEEVIVGLWNATVSRQCAKTLESSTLAVLRQLCFDLLSSPFCIYTENDSNSKPKSYTQRKLMMATKCSKAWLEIKEFNKAESVLQKAQDDIKVLVNFSNLSNMEKTDSKQVADEVVMLNKCQVTVYCYLAEVAFEKLNYEESYSYLHQCSLLPFLTCEGGDPSNCIKEKERICALAYNFGLRRSKDHALPDAIKWLSFSCDYGKQERQCEKALLAQCLRLLAHVYCETGIEENLSKSMKIVEEANSVVSHPASLQLKTSLFPVEMVYGEAEMTLSNSYPSNPVTIPNAESKNSFTLKSEWRNKQLKLSDTESSSSEKTPEESRASEVESTHSNDIEEEFPPMPDGSPTFTAVMNELGSNLSKTSLSEHVRIPVLPSDWKEEAPVVKSLHFDLHNIQPHSFYSPATPRKRLESSIKSPELRARSQSLLLRSKSATERRNVTFSSSLNSSRISHHFVSPLMRRKKKPANHSPTQVAQPRFRIQSENISVSHEDIVREHERERHLAEGFAEVKSIFKSPFFDRLE